MRKLILLLTLLIVYINGYSQLQYQQTPTSIIIYKGYLGADSGIVAGILRDTSTVPVSKRRLGLIIIDTTYNGYIWNGSMWKKFSSPTGGGGSSTLTGLTDVTISSPVNNQFLRYNSGTGKWVNSTFTESDPVFGASAAFGITGTNITNWNSAYNSYPTGLSFNTASGLFTLTKRDGTTLTINLDGRYLTSYTETDPVAIAKTITATQGYGVTISGTAGQTLNSNPSWTFIVDTTKIIPFTDTSKYVGILTFTRGNSLYYPLTGNPSGFLTSFTETDPIFGTSSAAGITGTDISHWNAAYDKYPTGLGFAGGILTLTKRDGTTLTVSLDGRYELALGYTAENQANKATTFGTINNTLYPSVQAVVNYVTGQGYLTSAITSLNGLTGATQTFTTPGTSGTAPNWSSSGTAHTLNIPLASASSVTAGLLSKTKYDEFDAKADEVIIPGNNVLANTTGSSAVPSNGLPYSSVSNASSLAFRDAFQNIYVNNIFPKGSTVVASGSTHNMDLSYPRYHQLTGGAGLDETFILPDATTLVRFTTYRFDNNSASNMIVQSYSGGYVATLTPGSINEIQVLDVTTVDGQWDKHPFLNAGSICDNTGIYISGVGDFTGNISANNFSGNSSNTNTGDQNLFSSIVVSGQTTVTANSTTTALTLIEGSGITITTNNTTKEITITASGSGVATVSGTAGRITSTGGANPVIDIDANYVGQASIITVGTISNGTWQGTAIADAYISSATNWNTAYSNRIGSFTTTGSSGAATFTPGGALNIPQYTLAGLGGTTDHAALSNLIWTSSGHLGAGAGLAGFNSSSVTIVYTLSGTGTVIPTTVSPSFTTPTLGVAVATSINGNTFTTGTYTLTGASGKTFTFNNTLTFNGTDGTTMTFPGTSQTISGLGVQQTYTKSQTVAKVDLTDAATIAVDLSLSNDYEVVLGGNRTLGVPTNPSVGQKIAFNIWEDITTGTYTLSYAWPYMFAGGTAPTITTGKGALSMLVGKVLYYGTSTVTMTIASPCVITWTAHGMKSGQRIQFTTTGALPTGVSASTTYWVTVVDANSFKISTSQANMQAGTFINSSGSQSGTHTATTYGIFIGSSLDIKI